MAREKISGIAGITGLAVVSTSMVWAGPYDLEVQNGLFSGFSATFVHQSRPVVIRFTHPWLAP